MQWRCCMGVGVLAIVAAARAARACTFVLIPPAVVPTDAAQVGRDTSPPRVLKVDYQIDEPPEVSASCGLPAMLMLSVRTEDDQTPAEKMRFRSEGVEGDTPRFFDYLDPVEGLWFFLDARAPAPLEGSLRVWAVDEAGNESAPMLVQVTERAEAAEGCGFVPARAGSASMLGACGLALALLASRRRRRS